LGYPAAAATPFGENAGRQGEPQVTVSTVRGRPWFRKKRFIIPGALVGLVILGSALGGAGDAKTPAVTDAGATSARSSQSPATPSAAAPTSKAAARTPAATKAPAVVDNAPAIGTKVRDGKFEFVVTGLKCGIDSVGSDGFDTKAQGEFCRVSITISNIGNEAQSMSGDNQVAFDAKDRRFSASSEAAIYDPKSEVLFEKINPGNTIKGRVYFDVPRNTTLVKIELHDSMFSGGVDVALRK